MIALLLLAYIIGVFIINAAFPFPAYHWAVSTGLMGAYAALIATLAVVTA